MRLRKNIGLGALFFISNHRYEGIYHRYILYSNKTITFGYFKNHIKIYKWLKNNKYKYYL